MVDDIETPSMAGPRGKAEETTLNKRGTSYVKSVRNNQRECCEWNMNGKAQK